MVVTIRENITYTQKIIFNGIYRKGISRILAIPLKTDSRTDKPNLSKLAIPLKIDLKTGKINPNK